MSVFCLSQVAGRLETYDEQTWLTVTREGEYEN